MTKELSELVEKARAIKMTPEQQAEQRRSFAYGNTHIENKRITRELIADIDRTLEGAAQDVIEDIRQAIEASKK